KMLGVGQQSLEEKGAVSPEVAKEMAAGARARLGTDLALATTGIAGPDGGSDAKPVGLVYIGLATPQGIEAKKFQFYGGRDSVRALTVQAALNWLRLYLAKFERRFH
ncbi:MAG: CinA family protein, partial [Desulfitobacteriaceae bacterium]